MANRMSWAGGTGAHNAPQSMEPEVMGKRSTHAPGGQALTATRRRRVGGSTRTTKVDLEGSRSRKQSPILGFRRARTPQQSDKIRRAKPGVHGRNRSGGSEVVQAKQEEQIGRSRGSRGPPRRIKSRAGVGSRSFIILLLDSSLPSH
ncbi:hypothetical protein AVEN_208780-1 [Araneus ventricosus]|uniref:Uncharacterized protein n=1 Tax=Araneus ventricosus TaxID=182803 RepID=A0A4Y2UQV9_ARAVE|nr:hypothetical protein AVEN_143926-1 [Araneus ventricosus]GBO15375.1 hypothetical protein AVEN_85545-1 [Araneus ventricosus]GBO18662.1 hypothetical protein AVEN_208780-1 [Araneus ventricosus]